MASWKTGLIHIYCSECGRDLDWAQPEFVKVHPAPLCWKCREQIEQGALARKVVYLPRKARTR
jgi:hypothetical protein